jgi:hypothetical protein
MAPSYVNVWGLGTCMAPNFMKFSRFGGRESLHMNGDYAYNMGPAGNPTMSRFRDIGGPSHPGVIFEGDPYSK